MNVWLVRTGEKIRLGEVNGERGEIIIERFAARRTRERVVRRLCIEFSFFFEIERCPFID